MTSAFFPTAWTCDILFLLVNSALQFSASRRDPGSRAWQPASRAERMDRLRRRASLVRKDSISMSGGRRHLQQRFHNHHLVPRHSPAASAPWTPRIACSCASIPRRMSLGSFITPNMSPMPEPSPANARLRSGCCLASSAASWAWVVRNTALAAGPPTTLAAISEGCCAADNFLRSSPCSFSTFVGRADLAFR